MSGPIGELEELIVKALQEGKADPAEVAEQIAPHVIWKESLEHVGWLNSQTGDLTAEKVYEDDRAVFCKPAATVEGAANLPIRIGVASD